jgi:integrase
MTDEHKAQPRVDESVDAASLTDLVRSQASQIAQLLSALEAQGKMLARAFEARPEPAPVVPAREAVTLADLWTRYVQSLGTERKWVYNVVSMMTPTLAHFAPSVVAARPRRGRFPSRPAAQGPDMLVSDLRPHHWSDWREWMRAHLGVGVTYRNLILKRLKTFLNWGVAEKRIAENPLAGAKNEPKQPRRETTMTELDLQRMLGHNLSPVFRAHLMIACDTGMRTDEIRRLTWDQIDMLTGIVRLSWTTTKTKKSRTVKLLPRDLQALRELPRYDHTRYVFGRSTRDTPYSQSRFWSWFREAADAVGVQAAPGDGRIHFHDATRHSFATRALRAGIRLNQLQKLLGHASIQTTGLYAHTTDDDIEDAHRLLMAASGKEAHEPTEPDDDE